MPGRRPQDNYVNLVVAGETRTTRIREMAEPPSPQFSFSREPGAMQRSIRHFCVPPPNSSTAVWQLVNDFLGMESVIINPALGGSSTRFISRTIPANHPNFPWILYAEAVRPIEPSVLVPSGGIRGNPAQDGVGVGQPDEWKIAVEYTGVPYTICTDTQLLAAQNLLGGGNTIPDEATLLRYVSWDFQATGYAQSMPESNGLKWAGTPLDPAGGAMPATIRRSMPLYEGDLTIIWHRVPYTVVPWQLYVPRSVAPSYGMIGTCNQPYVYGPDALGPGNTNPFGGISGGAVVPDSLIPPFPPYTLVCGVPRVRIYKQALAQSSVLQWLCDVIYRFKYYPQGANSWYRSDAQPGPGFQLATWSGLANQAQGYFPPADFSTLFRGIAA